MAAQMQQLQDQSQQQQQAMGQQLQQASQELQKVNVQLLQEKASKAQMQAADAARGTDQQIALQTQAMKSHDVAAHVQIDQDKARMDLLQQREEMAIKREQLNLQAYESLVGMIAKLGPMMGAQGAQAADQQLPGAVRVIEGTQ